MRTPDMISRRSIFGVLAALPFIGKAFGNNGNDWRAVVRASNVETTRLFAAKGERVTCMNGHFICEFTRDVNVGEMFDPAAMGNWQQPAPERGTMHYDAPCNVREPGAALPCGAPWFNGTHYHFADGWR